VAEQKISALQDLLKSRGQSSVLIGEGTGARKTAKEPPGKYRRLLKFRGKYPLPIFYDPLEDEINTAYNNPALPNAVLVLSRKLIENLVYNLLEYRFQGPGIGLYYNTGQRRAHDFSVLLDNLSKNKSEFELDLQEHIDRFLRVMAETNFRREANSKTHTVMEYLGSMKEVSKLKIPDMVQILLLLIDRVKEPEPKFLNVTKAQPLGNGLLLSITNAGNSSESLTD
jgi:hypothetical protein